jgi:hypothetical protein
LYKCEATFPSPRINIEIIAAKIFKFLKFAL